MSKWPMVKLGDISHTIDYGVTASATTDSNGYKFLRITDIQENCVDWDLVPWCICSEKEALKSFLKEGDIVFARTGATTGKSYLIKECPENTVFASYLIRVRLSQKALPTYVGCFFKSPYYWQQISNSSRGAAQPGVNSTVLQTLTLPLPPLPEQMHIVELLDRAQGLIDHRKEQLALMDTLTQSLFYEMFGDPVKNEMGWEMKKIGAICTLVSDGVHAKPNYLPSGIPFISVKDLINGEISFTNTKYIAEEDYKSFNKRCNPEYNDILYTKVGARYGRPAIVNTKCPFSIYVSLALLKPNHTLVDSIFLRESLISPFIFQQACKAIKGIGVPDLHLIEIKNFTIPLPSLKKQQLFADRVQKIEETKQRMSASLAELEQTFNALMQESFYD